MFERFCSFFKRFDFREEKNGTSDTISPRKRHIEDDDMMPHRVKLRRTDNFDPQPRRHISSDQFLFPFKELHSRKMASSCKSALNTSGDSQTCSTLPTSTQKWESKENVVFIEDSEEEEEEEEQEQQQQQEEPKDKEASKSNIKPDVTKWLAAKIFPESETFRISKSLNSDSEQKRMRDDDVEVVKFVESFTTKAKRQSGCTIVGTGLPPPQNTMGFYQKMKGNRVRSSPLGRPSERESLQRRTALQESFRLDEKKQYSQLLQNFTRSPVANVTIRNWSKSGTNLSDSLIKTAKKKHSSTVELVDLTINRQQDWREGTRIEVKMDLEAVPYTSASRMDLSKSELKFPQRLDALDRKWKERPVCDPKWTSDILKRFDAKQREMDLRLEKEKITASLRSRKSQELIQGVLAEQMMTYMKISGAAVKEVIDLDDDDDELKLPQLTSAMEKLITSAFRGGPASEVLVEAFSQKITRRDIHTLAASNWLNDEVINFYMNLLIERGKLAKYPSMYGFNTFFYPKLSSSGHGALKRWTRKVDIFSHEILIVPIHLGVHWCMASINLKEKTIRYYDSMGGRNNTCLSHLMKYLQDECLDKKKQHFDLTGWSTINVENNPQQMNGSDCGMFSCMYAEFICRRAKINFTQADMPYFRRKMVYEIITKKLLM